MSKPALWDIHTASDADAQRRRLDARAKLLRPLTLEPRICVVVGGRGRLRELAWQLAAVIGHGRLPAELVPSDTVAMISAVTLGGVPPRVVILAPLYVSRPLVAEIQRMHPHWPAPVDLLYGVHARDRQAQLRHMLRSK